ncbi:hypothetical protein ABZP36_023425 [Zizania latifolia]
MPAGPNETAARPRRPASSSSSSPDYASGHFGVPDSGELIMLWLASEALPLLLHLALCFPPSFDVRGDPPAPPLPLPLRPQLLGGGPTRTNLLLAGLVSSNGFSAASPPPPAPVNFTLSSMPLLQTSRSVATHEEEEAEMAGLPRGPRCEGPCRQGQNRAPHRKAFSPGFHVSVHGARAARAAAGQRVPFQEARPRWAPPVSSPALRTLHAPVIRHTVTGVWH